MYRAVQNINIKPNTTKYMQGNGWGGEVSGFDDTVHLHEYGWLLLVSWLLQLWMSQWCLNESGDESATSVLYDMWMTDVTWLQRLFENWLSAWTNAMLQSIIKILVSYFSVKWLSINQPVVSTFSACTRKECWHLEMWCQYSVTDMVMITNSPRPWLLYNKVKRKEGLLWIFCILQHWLIVSC